MASQSLEYIAILICVRLRLFMQSTFKNSTILYKTEQKSLFLYVNNDSRAVITPVNIEIDDQT